MKRVFLVALLAASVAAAELGPVAGRPLAEVLQKLQEQGLALIFSSELVRPELRVQHEPQATRPEDVLVEILRPHGLAVSPGPAGRLLVVRAPAPAVRRAAPASPPPLLAFGSEVRIVRLDATVLDDDGRFVSDLRAADFEIEEDGARQQVVTFNRAEVPVSLVLLLDSSASMSGRLGLSRAAAAGFLDTLRPGDEAAVLQFNDTTTVLQAMTAERDALRRAIDRVTAQGSTALYNALFAALRDVPGPDPGELRRRVVVLLSDGADTASLVWEEQVLELARRREATLHVIDLGGEDASHRSARLLRLLAAESGGEVHRPGSAADLPTVYGRISEELRSQYTIGFQSTADAADARWRRLKVRVRGRADLQVRHRAGYYASP